MNKSFSCHSRFRLKLTLTLCSLRQDGTVIVHTVRRGQVLRTLRPPGNSCVPAQISALQVGMEGHIVVQTALEERSNRKVHGCIQYSLHFMCTHSKFLSLFMPPSWFYLFLQGKYSIYVYSVNGCLMSSFTMEEQVTALHLVSEYVILGTMQGSLHIRDLYRWRNWNQSLVFSYNKVSFRHL